MFVVVSKYTGTPHVINCVRSIRQFHPDEEILIVDSASEDKSYFDLLKEFNVLVADIDNRHYSTGALHHAFDYYVRDYYFFIQDSMELIESLDYCKQFELSTWSWFDMVPYGLPEEVWAREQITRHTSFTIPPAPYYNCFGIAGGLPFCRREVLEKLYSTGFKNILETNKEQNMCMERLHGLALSQLGYDVRENSVWGNWQSPSLQKIKKVFLSRP